MTANSQNKIRQAALTPVSDQVPVVIQVPIKELSGAGWVSRYPTSKDMHALTSPFSSNVISFVGALRSAGATVIISATVRPPERAYLMHYSWKIVAGEVEPNQVPSKDDILIRWDHIDSNGNYSKEKSISAAREMVRGYGISNLRVAPALNSRHIEGNAIDMSISWSGALQVENSSGTMTIIDSEPRTGMNVQLHSVGTTYGVIKFRGGNKDKPHWSSDGR